MEQLKRKIVEMWKELDDPRTTVTDLCCYLDEAGECSGVHCDECPLGSAAYLVSAIKTELGISE